MFCVTGCDIPCVNDIGEMSFQFYFAISPVGDLVPGTGGSATSRIDTVIRYISKGYCELPQSNVHGGKEP